MIGNYNEDFPDGRFYTILEDELSLFTIIRDEYISKYLDSLFMSKLDLVLFMWLKWLYLLGGLSGLVCTLL